MLFDSVPKVVRNPVLFRYLLCVPAFSNVQVSLVLPFPFRLRISGLTGHCVQENVWGHPLLVYEPCAEVDSPLFPVSEEAVWTYSPLVNIQHNLTIMETT